MVSNCLAAQLAGCCVLTDDKVQSEDPLPLRVPPWHLNVHLVDIFLVGQLLEFAVDLLAGLTAPHEGFSLLSYLPAAGLGSLAFLPLGDVLLDSPNDVPSSRLD